MSRVLLHTDASADGRPEFVSIRQTSELSTSLESAEEEDWVAVATATENLDSVDWPKLLELPAAEDRAVLSAYADDPVAFALERLPANVAVLTTSVTAGRVVAARGSALGSWAEEVSGWNVGYANDAERIACLPAEGGGPFPATLLPELGPGRPSQVVGLQQTIRTVADSTNVRAGLLLFHDHLDESHTLAQSSGNRDGDFWHAIMHRREPDYSNSKYWFRQVGDHAIFASLAESAARLAAGSTGGAAFEASPSWDPFRFVDLCAQAARDGGSLETLCRQIAQAEWCLLFDYCYQRALGR